MRVRRGAVPSPRRFNPHPPVGAGATHASRLGVQPVFGFQSSPARGGGCNGGGVMNELEIRAVSILTRPWGRVQRGCCRSLRSGYLSFNPHPPVGAGATRRADVLGVFWERFQSSPARGGGCNACSSAGGLAIRSFQSSPARGGGCNEPSANSHIHISPVSILTRPWGRVQRLQLGRRAGDTLVSILTRPWGRVQRCSAVNRIDGIKFQSSPARGGGCNPNL